MTQKTYAQLKDYVLKKLDLQEETFITSDEMLLYCEEAIKYCEAEVHKLRIEDQYFQANSVIELVSGKQDYALPSNMYGNKIMKIMYSNGQSNTHDIKRMTKSSRFYMGRVVEEDASQVVDNYSYMLVNNDVRSGTKIRLYPSSKVTSLSFTLTGAVTSGSAVVTGLSSTSLINVGMFVTSSQFPLGTRVQSVDSSTQVTLDTAAISTSATSSCKFIDDTCVIWYIRRASVPVATTDYIDFPEFWHFIAQHMIVECLKKEIGNPRLTPEMAKLEVLTAQVHATLSDMTPDGEDMLEMDTSSYDEQGSLGYGD